MVKGARGKPILDECKAIFHKQATRQHESLLAAKARKESGAASSIVTEYCAEQHEGTIEEAKSLHVIFAEGTASTRTKALVSLSEVGGHGHTCSLDLDDPRLGSAKCDCMAMVKFQRICKHIVALLLALRARDPSFNYSLWDGRWFGSHWHTDTWLRQHGTPLPLLTLASLKADSAHKPAALQKQRGPKKKNHY